MDTNKIKAIILAAVAIFVAIYLGTDAATAQFEAIAWLLGGLTFVMCLFLGRKIWLLIPFLSAVGLTFQIPGNPSSLLIAQILVPPFCTLLFLMRRLPFKFAWTELEFWVLIITLFVAQVYIRNPVGLNLFGGSTVGGKAYVLYVISLTSCFLLVGLRVKPGELKWILRLSIVGSLLNTLVSALGLVFPLLAYYTGGNVRSFSSYDNQVTDSRAATRVGFLSVFGSSAALWISAYISPLRACFRPLWAILLLLAIAASLASGFRSGLATVGLTLLLGILYRNGFVGLLLASCGAGAALASLAVVNLLHPLPPNIQRSLTFLPGTWEERYKADAEGSTEWRVEIWREVLLTDRWIRNKWLGDGLGFSASELAIQQNLNESKNNAMGISGFDAHRESILANGDYHSGPVSTIRVIGYVGLAFFLLAQIRLAVHAHRQIKRSRGTEWLPLALFVGIPLIATPLFFVFIFGDFRRGAVLYLISVGMVRLLENNLPLPAYVKSRRAHTPLPLPSHTLHVKSRVVTSE